MELFEGRDEELGIIEEVLSHIRNGERENLCLLGVPGSGKTALLKEYIRLHRERWEEEGVILVYSSIRDLGLSPAHLASGFVGEVLARVAFTFRAKIDLTELRRPETFVSCASAIRSDAVAEFLEILGESPDCDETSPCPPGLVEAAFRFPNRFAEERRIRLILFVDDLGELKKYASPSLLAFEGFHRALEGQSEAFYISAMTHSPFADKLFSPPEGPLEDSFRCHLMTGIPQAPAMDLASRFLDTGLPDADPRTAELIAKLSAGHPLVLRHIAQSTRSLAGPDRSPGPSDVATAFAAEILSPLGGVYRHYLTRIHSSVEIKADYDHARTVLASLAGGTSVTPDSIQEKTGIDLETSARIVGRILRSGLFRKVDDTFYFDDPLFRFWALKTEPGREEEPVHMSEKRARALAAEYLARFTEKVKPKTKRSAKKFNFRDLISACKNRSVPGELLGADGAVDFPDFAKVKGFAFTTKQVKMYYLEGAGEYWGLMIVWWPLTLDSEPLEILHRKADERLSRLWFVCRGGFSPKARARARELAVLTSDESDLKKILESIS